MSKVKVGDKIRSKDYGVHKGKVITVYEICDEGTSFFAGFGPTRHDAENGSLFYSTRAEGVNWVLAEEPTKESILVSGLKAALLECISSEELLAEVKRRMEND